MRLRIQPEPYSFESDSSSLLTTESPLESDDDLLQLSSPSSSSSSPIALNVPDAEELSRDLAALALLRQSVQKNLRLRPIRSFSKLPKTAVPNVATIPWQYQPHKELSKSASSSPKSASSTYLTPLDVCLPAPPPSSPPVRIRKLPQRSASMPSPRISTSAMDPADLVTRLASPTRPLLIDTRPLAAYAASHLIGSINIAMPSLILKRAKRTLPTFESLRQFITTDEGKDIFDARDKDGDVVIVHGEETSELEKDNTGVTAWALLSVLLGLMNEERVWYLRGGIIGAQLHTRLRKYIVNSPSPYSHSSSQLSKPRTAKGKAFLQLDTNRALGPGSSVQIEQEDQGHEEQTERQGHSVLPVMPGISLTLDSPTDYDPPPSQLAFRRPPRPRRSNASTLSVESVEMNGTDAAACSSTENKRTLTKPLKHAVTTLPRLQIHTAPTTRNATLPVTPSQQTVFFHPPPASPSHLTLLHSNHTPPASAFNLSFNSSIGNASSSPPVPLTPSTARPTPTTSTPGTTSTTDNEREEFTVSMILPNFLFLGPELTLPSHVSELESLGVKRIINIAAECTDDRGLMLRERFERYVHIPMRDSVEEEGIRMGLSEACDVLGKCGYSPNTPLNHDDNSRSLACSIHYISLP